MFIAMDIMFTVCIGVASETSPDDCLPLKKSNVSLNNYQNVTIFYLGLKLRKPSKG